MAFMSCWNCNRFSLEQRLKLGRVEFDYGRRLFLKQPVYRTGNVIKHTVPFWWRSEFCRQNNIKVYTVKIGDNESRPHAKRAAGLYVCVTLVSYFPGGVFPVALGG